MGIDADTRTLSGAAGRRGPGPSWPRMPKYVSALLRDPLLCYSALRRDYGDVVRVPFTRRRAFYVLSHPGHVEHVLVTHQENYPKAFTYRALKTVLGDGLLTSEGSTWQRHRRLVQPVFGARHVQTFAPQMTAAATARAATWTGSIDLVAEMRALTIDIVGRVLFGTDLAADAEPVGRAVRRLQDTALFTALLPGSQSARENRAVVSLIPGLANAARTLDDLVDGVIERRLASPHEEPADLLDLLIAGDGQAPLSATEIRDEVITLVLAGHETTASTLVWTFALLSLFPAARERLHAELDEVLAGRDPVASDVDDLVWTGAVVREALRLYPPAWTIERDAVADDVISGVAIPAGSTVAVSPYLLHRDPRFWPNPEGFDPGRFLPGHDRPRYSYLPFGGGRRICVGAGFAQLEATLALATIASRYRLDLLPGTPVRARAGATLHPRGSIPVTVTARAR